MISVCSNEWQQAVLDYVEYRFALSPDLFESYGFYSASNGRIFIGPKDQVVTQSVETIGVLIARIQKSVKPSSDLFQMFGKHITRSVIDINSEQLIGYCQGADIDTVDLCTENIIPGFVMVRYNDIPIGCGLLRESVLENQIPKECRIRLELAE